MLKKYFDPKIPRWGIENFQRSAQNGNSHSIMSMITATSWVPRGHAAAFPTKYVFDEEEYGRIAKLAKLQLEDAEEDLKKPKPLKVENPAPNHRNPLRMVFRAYN